jgi:hypothetical protein
LNKIDVEERAEGLYPIRLRERIRLSGPTIVTFGDLLLDKPALKRAS